ncbi:hypothetical protein Droror1_Dr00001951 [Drosera rotundifolia]
MICKLKTLSIAMAALSLSDGMIILEGAFGRATKILEGYPHAGFSVTEYMTFYECVYNLCTPKIGFENAQAIYARYDEVMKECIILSVLPLLEGKRDVALLTTLVQILPCYKLMAARMYKIFHYIDRYYTPNRKLLPLSRVSLRCFHYLVNNRYSNDFQSAVRALVNQQRNGEKVACDLVKTILDFFVEAKTVGATCYDDFEKAILADAAAYYSQMASYGLSNCSYIHYVSQACMSMNQENERTSRFLDPSTRRKLLQVARIELLDRVSGLILEKRQAENNITGNHHQEVAITHELENYLSELMTRVDITP